MNLLTKILRMSVFRKVFIGFLIVAIPLYGISIVTTWISGQTISRETQVATHSKLQFFLDYLQNELQDVNQMLVALNNDPDLPSLYIQQNQQFDYELVQLSQQIKTKMNIVYHSSEYISDVFMIFPDTNLQLSINNEFTEIDMKRKAALNRHLGKSSQVDRFIDSDTITYSIAATDNKKRKVNYLLGVDISQMKIIEALKKFNIDNKYHVFLVDNQSERYVGNELLSETDKQIYEIMSQSSDSSSIALKGVDYMIQSSKDDFFTVISYVSKDDVLGSVYSLRKYFWILVICSILFSLIYSIFVYQQVHKPLNRLVKTMKEVEKGNLNIRFNAVQVDEFGYVYKQFDKMVSQLRNLIQEVLENKINMQQAQLKQLQSQINPHFLFNCFYIGYRMAKSGENESVAKLCKYLGDYFRFVTQHSQQEVYLKDEMKYTTTYLEIQMMRFSNKLSYSIESDVFPDELMVPSLIIQPLVENSLLHGIEKVNRPGHIIIRLKSEDDQVRIEIKDNGIGMEESEIKTLKENLEVPSNHGDHCGLWNVHWRLKHKYGEDCGLSIRNEESSGLNVSFVIPNRILSREDIVN